MRLAWFEYWLMKRGIRHLSEQMTVIQGLT
jgi:hypothetical protein